MSERADPAVADPDAPAAPPRSNGDLVFEAPWESRAFGLAVALHDAGVLEFELFRERLIAEIGRWEAEHGPEAEGYRYYECWLTALERVLFDRGLVDQTGVATARDGVARAWEHDHHH